MVRLGILGCSDIAFKRFMPAAKNIADLKIVAVGEEYDRKKLEPFCREYNLEGEDSFGHLIAREDIDAVYVPQPPALHYKWAKQALENGKHVLVEKPSTISYALSKDLVDAAAERELTLHENYMFQYHSQISAIKDMLSNGTTGDIRLIKADFGFPLRAKNDFRYSKALGGGALLDAGGYTAKLATLFLGKTVKVDTAQLNYLDDFEVDMYGSASLSNSDGLVCQVGFGMDCAYQCSLEVWGSRGRLYTNRIFTAPEGYQPLIRVEMPDGVKEFILNADSHFEHSIERFLAGITDRQARTEMYGEILLQAKLVDDIRKTGERKNEETFL